MNDKENNNIGQATEPKSYNVELLYLPEMWMSVPRFQLFEVRHWFDVRVSVSRKGTKAAAVTGLVPQPVYCYPLDRGRANAYVARLERRAFTAALKEAVVAAIRADESLSKNQRERICVVNVSKEALSE